MKYDSHGTWESNNYHGLGWTAKHVWAKESAPPQKSIPTPLANDAKKYGNFDINDRRNGLAGACRRPRVTVPTPIRSDATVSKTDYVLHSVAAGKAFNQLAREVLMQQRVAAGTWPASASPAGGFDVGGPPRRQRQETPTAKNGLRGGSGSANRPMMHGQPGDADYGELNPAWVEWLMDWPIGWTSLQPMAAEDFRAWERAASAGEPGAAMWWAADPSDGGAIPRTTGKGEPARGARIAALGNGQVSAVAAAAYLHLYNLEFPKENQP